MSNDKVAIVGGALPVVPRKGHSPAGVGLREALERIANQACTDSEDLVDHLDAAEAVACDALAENLPSGWQDIALAPKDGTAVLVGLF